MNTEQANRFLDGLQIKDRSIYDSQDNEHPLDCILEDYHQEQLKLLNIPVVIGQSEQLPNRCKVCGRTDEERLTMTSMCGVSACPY